MGDIKISYDEFVPVEPANLKLIVIFQLCDCFTVFLFYEINSFKQALTCSQIPWPGNLFATVVITNSTSEKKNQVFLLGEVSCMWSARGYWVTVKKKCRGFSEFPLFKFCSFFPYFFNFSFFFVNIFSCNLRDTYGSVYWKLLGIFGFLYFQ